MAIYSQGSRFCSISSCRPERRVTRPQCTFFFQGRHRRSEESELCCNWCWCTSGSLSMSEAVSALRSGGKAGFASARAVHAEQAALTGNPWPVMLGQVAFGVAMGMGTALYVFAVKG